MPESGEGFAPSASQMEEELDISELKHEISEVPSLADLKMVLLPPPPASKAAVFVDFSGPQVTIEAFVRSQGGNPRNASLANAFAHEFKLNNPVQKNTMSVWKSLYAAFLRAPRT